MSLHEWILVTSNSFLINKMHYHNFQREESDMLSGEEQLDIISSWEGAVVLSLLHFPGTYSLSSPVPSASGSEP